MNCMIEILNKKSRAVINVHQNNIPTITFQTGVRIAFTGRAAEICNLRVGKKVNFLVLHEKSWCFYVDDNQDGYTLYMPSNKQRTVAINAKSIIDLFALRTGHKLPARFYIQERGTEYQGKPLFEILTNKPINEIGK